MGRVRPHFAHALLLRGAQLFALFMLAAASPARARAVRVPEDFSTIQAAVDHLTQLYVLGADTVLVQAGHYPERVFIQEAMRLQGVPAPGSAEPVPRIDGLLVQPPSFGRDPIEVIGIHVAGPARTAGSDGPDRVYYESCRFDAGMEGGNWFPDIAVISLRRCTLFGTLSLKALETVVDSCTLYGPLVMLTVGAAVVTDNVFENIPGFAADVFCEQRLHIARNVVRGGGGGFRLRGAWDDFGRVEDNRIEGCAGTGIYVDSPDFFAFYIERNHVIRCGGVGIEASGLIRATENRVLDCGGQGMVLVQQWDLGVVERNVVGRCGGDGIRLGRYDWAQDPTGFHTRSNTVYDCGGAGVAAYALTAGSISKNIAHRNRGVGLLSVGNEVPISCNDWFENQAGATSGVAASPSDLAVDPLFCDLAAGDVHLRADSPLLDAPGCGRIGALGQGCEPPPVPIAFHFSPPTLNLASRGRWVIGVLEPAAPFAASDIEVASVRLNGVPVDPVAPGALGDHDRNGIPDLTVRFGRVAVARTLEAGHGVTVTGLMRGRAFIGTESVRVTRAVDLAPVENGTSSDATPAALAIRGTSAAPGRMRVEFALPATGPARVELLDVAGRTIESAEVGERGPGRHSLELAPSGELRQGIYFLRLQQGVNMARTRVVVVR